MKNYLKPIDNDLSWECPRELSIIESYLSPRKCEKIVSLADSLPSMATSIGEISAGGHLARTSSKGFIANRIDIPRSSPLYKYGDDICKNIYKVVVRQHYGVTIKSYETPHILRYTAGGTYGIHSDSHRFDPAQEKWIKVMNRDFSSILYLNDAFTGGALSFPQLNIRLTPRTGMLVTFPSDDRYMHTAEPVETGLRYAFVTWAAKRGGKGVPNAPRGHIIKLK